MINIARSLITKNMAISPTRRRMKIKFEIEPEEKLLETAIQIRKIEKKIEEMNPMIDVDFIFKQEEEDEFKKVMDRYKKTLDLLKR